MMRIPRRHILRDILRQKVEDERFLEIFAGFARLIHTSVELCNRDALFPEDEVNYVEELLGVSFVLLQAKIRRVVNAAERFSLTRGDIFNIGGDNYKGTQKNIIRLIWEVANYYKHHDDWSRKVWEDKKPGKEKIKALEQSRKTRRIIEKLGIERSSAGMRTAYKFFEIEWASDCTPLANKVQEWANAVYEKCANP